LTRKSATYLRGRLGAAEGKFNGQNRVGSLIGRAGTSLVTRLACRLPEKRGFRWYELLPGCEFLPTTHTLNAPPDCSRCPRLVGSRRAVVNGSGLLPSRVLVIAQNPGREEEVQGAPLVGWSGKKLDYLAGLAGLTPGSYRKENVVRCRPPRGKGGDLPPKPDEIANCTPFLRAAIEACHPEFIVTLGAPALKWFFPLGKLETWHGRVIEWTEALPEGVEREGGIGLCAKLVPMYHPAAAHPARNPGLATVMCEDWTRLGELLKGAQQNKLGRYRAVSNIETFSSDYTNPFTMPENSGLREVAFDYETNDPTWQGTFQAVRAHPIGVSVAVKEGEAVYWATEDVSLLKSALEAPGVIKVAHNAVFEYIVSRSQGITPANLHCTKLMAYVLRCSSTHLKDLAWSELGIKQTRFEEVDWADANAVAQYGAADSDIALRLYHRLGARLREQGLWDLYEMERACLPVLAEMTIAGIAFDPAPLAALETQLVVELAEREADLLKYFKADALPAEDAVNLNSDAQLRALLYGPTCWRASVVRELAGRLQHDANCARRDCVEMACAQGVHTGAQAVLRWLVPGLGWRIRATTPTGEPAVDMDTLRLYDHPVVGDLVRLKSIRQALENNVTRLPQLVQEDGRIHPVFHQAGQWEERAGDAKEAPRTGRLSSSGPNLQNITHHGDSERPYVAEWARHIRRGFVAGPDKVLVKVDIGQEEPRIGAFLAQDQDLLNELESGDVYCPVASLEFGRTITKADIDERQIGKRGWMAWLNGAGPAGIQQSAFWLSSAEALRVVKYLQNRHPKVEQYRASLVERLRAVGYTTTHFGRRVYRPEVWSGPGPARDHAERSVVPDDVQGTAADVMKIWLSRIARRLADVSEARAQLLLVVHDEVLLECLPDHIDIVVNSVRAALSGILPVRLPAEVAVGPNWADMVAY